MCSEPDGQKTCVRARSLHMITIRVCKSATVGDVDKIGMSLGSVGLMLVTADDMRDACCCSQQSEATLSPFWLPMMWGAKKRFEEITGRELSAASRISNEESLAELVNFVLDEHCDCSAEAAASVTAGSVCLILFPSLCQHVIAGDVCDSLLPSHGISSSEARDRKMLLVPTCVVQPKMHRRIALSSLWKTAGGGFSFAIRPQHLAMESLQKADLLGKYGA